MNGNHVPGIARSNYRQLKLLVTLESNGTASYRIYGKKLEDTWAERHCLVHDRVHHATPILSVDDVIASLIDILREQRLPGID